MRMGAAEHLAILVLCLAILSVSYPVQAGNIGPDAPGSKYAAAENLGWINFIPAVGDGVTATDTQVTGFAWAENVGWVHLNPGNCGECGVKNDGDGNLSGFAWSEAAGWISFSCANTGSCTTVDYGVKIDPDTGTFSGFAWGENTGWISFSCNNSPADCTTAAYGVATAWVKTSSSSSGPSASSGPTSSDPSYSDPSGSQGSPDPEPDPSLPDNGIVDQDVSNSGYAQDLVIQPGATIDNQNGTIAGGTNSGTIVGGTLQGELDNDGGTLQGEITLAGGAKVDGGTITGSVSGAASDKAVITNALIDADALSNVVIGNGCTITRDTAKQNPGLDLLNAVTFGGAVKTDIPLLVDDTGAEKSLNDHLSDTVSALLGTGNTQAQGDGTGVVTIAADGLGNAVVSAGVVSVVTTDQPDTVTLTPTGEILVVGNGVAMTLAPAAADMAGFKDVLSDLGASGDVGEDGVVVVELPGGSKLALRFDIAAEKNGAAFQSTKAPSPSISLEGDPAKAETLMVVITYADGTTQKMPPFIHHLPMFKKVTAGLNYTVDPSSGIISLKDTDNKVVWQGIPGYTLLDPPDAVIGMYFEPAGDLNGDGTDDIYVVTCQGRQPVYTLP